MATVQTDEGLTRAPSDVPFAAGVDAPGALRHWMALALESARRSGGPLHVARAEDAVAGGEQAEAWFSWLPDFSATLRHQSGWYRDRGWSEPRWRLDLLARAELSLTKATALGVAQAEHSRARAALREVEHEVTSELLATSFAMIAAERMITFLDDHLAELAQVTQGAQQGLHAGPATDAVLLQAEHTRVEAVRTDFVTVLSRARTRLATLTGASIASSRVDPRLAPGELIALSKQLACSKPGEAEGVAEATLTREQRRAEFAAVQSWYVPALRASAVAVFPESNEIDSDSHALRLEQTTGELSLAFTVRPGVPDLRKSSAAAVEGARFDTLSEKKERRLRGARARAQLDVLVPELSTDRALESARSEFRETTRRFARGERKAAEVIASSRRWVEVQLNQDALLNRAIEAQLAECESRRQNDPELHLTDPRVLSPRQVREREVSAPASAPAVLAARARANQALLFARSEDLPWKWGIEAGVLYPLYDRNANTLRARPELGLSGSVLAPVAVNEASLVGRLSFDYLDNARKRKAAQLQAELRSAQAELESRRAASRQLRIRLKLAHARQMLETRERAAQVAASELELLRNWRSEGFGSDSDVYVSEVAHQAALRARNSARAQLRSLQLELGAELGAAADTALGTEELPAVLEASLSQKHAARGLARFEAALGRRIAELEVAAARARLDELTNVPKGLTVLTQATQGLKAGGFSLTAGLGFNLDSPQDSRNALVAAEVLGKAQARLRTIDEQLARRYERARLSVSESQATVALERQLQERLAAEQAALTRDGQSWPQASGANLQRDAIALQLASLASKQREIEAAQSLALASLDLSEYRPSQGAPVVPHTARSNEESSQIGSLEVNPRKNTSAAPRNARGDIPVVAHWLEAKPGFLAAEGARAQLAAQPTRPAVLGGLRLVGPFAAGSYSSTRVPGPTTFEVAQADLGAGLAFHLDDAVSFLAVSRVRAAAQHAREAALRAAALQVWSEVAELWRARELHRLAVRREAGARDWLTRWVSPRYELGHLGNHAVAQAEADLTNAAVDLERARARLLAAEAALTTPELEFDMRLLDQYEQAFSTESTSRSDWRQLEITAPNRSPALRAARERASAQRTQASATSVRVLSPMTGLVEVRPSRTATDTETSEARRTTSSTERLLEFSVTVPFKPRELGSLIHA
ncbi:MAG TPA: TolC family protein, partial [Polyangiaceae bacterium]|nr:TolC family protein [Polyangiaceae bacterium]